MASNEGSKENLIKNLQDQFKAKHRELEQEQTKWSHDYNTLLSVNKNLELKVNELNDNIDKQSLNHKVNLETTKTRVNQLQDQLDNATLSLNSEKNHSKSLELQVDNLQRQETLHTNMISSLKVRINELETQLAENTSKDAHHAAQISDTHDRVSIFKLNV
jgi:chromosome segregation ATPase